MPVHPVQSALKRLDSFFCLHTLHYVLSPHLLKFTGQNRFNSFQTQQNRISTCDVFPDANIFYQRNT